MTKSPFHLFPLEEAEKFSLYIHQQVKDMETRRKTTSTQRNKRAHAALKEAGGARIEILVDAVTLKLVDQLASTSNTSRKEAIIWCIRNACEKNSK